MLSFLLSFFGTAFLTLLLVRFARLRSAVWSMGRMDGPQSVHAKPAARLGGIGIAGGLMLAGGLTWFQGRLDISAMLGMLLVCGAPALVAGLAEDLTGRVRPVWRLLATAASALLGVWLLGTAIERTDLWGFDWIAAHPAGAGFLAVLTVAGIANAVNIIDGLNGLASMCVLMMLLAITYVAGEVGDSTLVSLGLLGAGALLGFFIWNYPAGLIFLGDGGAYLIGFYLAELGILLVHRNPQVSPLFPLLLAIYPIFETLFSMYRRKVVRGHSVGMPDGVHLHSLIYRRMLRWAVGSRDAKALTRRNSMTAPYLWLLCMLAVIPSLLFWDDSQVLGVFTLLFGLSYLFLYSRIVRFKVPRWLVIRRE